MKTFVVLALLVGANLAAAAPRQAMPFKSAPAGRVAADLFRTVCPQLPVPCNPADVTAWVGVRDTAGPVYLIDASRPMLVALDAVEPSRADRARQWDFQDHMHSSPPSADGGSPEPLRIHPALYPVGAAGWAVAVVSERRAMYSGGGASFQVADFVPLEAPGKPAYAAVPFSCYQMIRACFYDREYRRSPHCHDESNGHLTIRFGEADARWTFVWHQTDWAAHEPKSKQVATQAPFRVAAGNTELPKDAAFCGGPVD
ncbi:hypothetical protein [Rhizobacter sp. Root1221]|uniref:hypothetical protein n=1 Tax=Rhizobacter sp. Root1221 TaxID=1736433 RepID=UPI0006F8ABE3|nr:hypothetical protein [Rhizobacter sp. Root1221]KQV94585.1 hypothetical protein ASC87_26175 [Rhizobacter sp. Root1221]